MRSQQVQELVKRTAFLFYAHEAETISTFVLAFIFFLCHSYHLPQTNKKSLFKEVRKRRFNSVLQITLTLKPCSSLYFVFCIYCATQKNFVIRITKKYKNVESNGEEA